MEVVSAPESICPLFDKVLFEDLAPPRSSFDEDYYGFLMLQQQQQQKPELVQDLSFSMTETTPPTVIEVTSKTTLLSEFEPRAFLTSLSRRGSIFREGEECIFAGRKFFIVPNTTSLGA